MKVLIINGSPRKDGNTEVAIREFEKVINEDGVETEYVRIGNETIKGCSMCLTCKETGECVINDCVNDLAKKLEEADGLLIASPVYFANANGTLHSLLQRLFYSTKFDKSMKVGASIACARRAGTSATFDDLNKYFLNANMPVVPSTYWNLIHGGYTKGDVIEDEEGIQTVRNLAHNMAFMIKAIKLGKDAYGLPTKESGKRTNFTKGA